MLKKLLLLAIVAVMLQVASAYAQKLHYSAFYRFGLVNSMPTANVESGRLYSSEFGVDLDFNVYEFDDDASLSLVFSPGVGRAMATLFGSSNLIEPFIVVNAPLMLQYKLGAFSTPETSKEHGFGLGLGVNTHYPFFWDGTGNYREFDGQNVSMFTVQPAIKLTYFAWSNQNFLGSVSLMATFGSTDANGISWDRGGYFLSFAKYFNY